MSERTQLTQAEEMAFRRWAQANQIGDPDHPEVKYDYRGYWRDVAAKGVDQTKAYEDGLHFPDTYKQHGHPTFSVESQYSKGRFDGGRWGGPDGETYTPSGAGFLMNGRGQQQENPANLAEAVRQIVLAKLGGAGKP